MNRPRVPARLLAREPLPGVAEALGSMDGFLLRDGAHWFGTRHDGVITVGRVSADPSQVLARRARWSDPAADGADTYCSPLPNGALAVSGREAVTVHEPDGTVRWVHRHRDWSHAPGASGACTPDSWSRRPRNRGRRKPPISSSTVGRSDRSPTSRTRGQHWTTP
ncbi:hypothetical protein ACFQ71_19495 [Streptomyces sp. NPDC056534]|uniref:hypothetical protein n=1 Tax=Streptomyces sp. NPDC056534 TaxID=3345857 RepID=UPI0036A6206C